MSAFRLIVRNLLYRKALSALTILSVAIAVALLLLVSLTEESLENGAARGYGPYELVMGAEGSDTQLVLNTFYHLGTPVGNIPYSLYETVQKSPNVEQVYAITRGDSLSGHPIIGVDAGYFATRYVGVAPAVGQWHQQTGDAVLGAHVAETLGLRIGDQFHGSHGEMAAEHGDEEHAAFMYTVVGILPPLQTADDKGVFTTVDYAWAVHGHGEEEHAGESAEEHAAHADERMITAMVVKPKGLMELQLLKLTYDKKPGVQAVYSSKVIASVLNMLDTGTAVFQFMGLICMVLAAIALLLSMLAAASERRRDVGLLRLIGKRRGEVVQLLVLEGLLLTAMGLLLGLVLGHVTAGLMQGVVFEATGIVIEPWQFSGVEWQLTVGALLLGGLASLLPAMRMYRVQPTELFR